MRENVGPMPQKKKRTTMSAEHKAALAQGRNEGRSVRLYLEALEAHKPKRGRKRTPESIAKRLDAIAALPDADPVSRLHLVQERFDLLAESAHLGKRSTSPNSGADFIRVSEVTAIAEDFHRTWLRLGVEAAVLKKAGIGRGVGWSPRRTSSVEQQTVYAAPGVDRRKSGYHRRRQGSTRGLARYRPTDPPLSRRRAVAITRGRVAAISRWSTAASGTR